MLDLDRQLREFGSFVDEAVEPVRAAEITHRRPAPVLHPVRRNLVIAGVAAAIVVLIIGAVVILDPFGSEGPFIEEPTTIPPTTTITTVATTAPEAPSTSTTPPVVGPPDISWVRVESDAFVGSGGPIMEEVIAGGPGLIAVGASWSEQETGFVWHSTNGNTWSRVPHDEKVFGDASIMAVTAGGPGFVAVGNAGGWDESGSAAVWVSEDGVTWSRVPHNETVFGGPGLQAMYDVTVGGPGLVAVGWDNPLEEGSDASAAVWTSIDGLTWDRVPHDEAVFGGPATHVMWAVATGEPGLVAVGHDGAWSGSGGPGQPAAVWTSPNGLTWTRVPDQEQLESGHPTTQTIQGGDWAIMNDVIAGGPGFVAVGRVGWCSGACDETAAAWTSVDGITWQRAQVEHAQGITATDMYGVVESGDVLIGAGWGSDPQSGTGTAVVWTSTDGGETWMRQPHSGAAFGKSTEGPVRMSALVEFASQLVAVGYWESHAAVWIGTIED